MKTMFIPLHSLPVTSRYPKMIRTIVAANLSPGATGKGNRAKRRAGIPVIDTTRLGPFGCVAMGAGEIAAMMRRAPD